MEPLSLRSTSRGVLTARVMMKNQSLKLIVITFYKKRPSSHRVIKRVPGNLSSQAGVDKTWGRPWPTMWPTLWLTLWPTGGQIFKKHKNKISKSRIIN